MFTHTRAFTRATRFAMLLAAAFSCAPAVEAAPASPAPAGLDVQLLSIQQEWARANYSAAGDAKEKAFEALEQRAESFVKAYPGRAEPLIWQGIVLSSKAGVDGGLGALGLAKRARSALEAALKIDANALEGSAYTSLGTLYYKVPGFPLGFGDHKKAKQMLEAALKINPAGIDPNYFYGEFLHEEGRHAEALVHLEKALAAAPRPNRELADRGRRGEIEALKTKVRAKPG